MNHATLPAFRFDGRRAEGLPVLLRIENASLVVETPTGTVLEREPLDLAVISEPFAHTPRLIGLRSGATLEVPDEDRRFARALHDAGVRLSLVVRLQRRWPAVIVALAALVALLAWVYVKGLPAAAHWAAFALPPKFEERMGAELLAVLDKHHLRPSRLDPAQRTRIAGRFAGAATSTAPGVRYQLEFRTTADDQINAMALPGGIIILLDGLVKLADDEGRVLGVLGHELGHVAHKHSTREMLQSIGVGAIAGLLWGDFSGAAASLPLALGVLRYSREFEREADEFAVAFLRAQGLSARPLHDFFLKVREVESEAGTDGIPDFLSTHPPTEERLERLRVAPE